MSPGPTSESRVHLLPPREDAASGRRPGQPGIPAPASCPAPHDARLTWQPPRCERASRQALAARLQREVRRVPGALAPPRPLPSVPRLHARSRVPAPVDCRLSGSLSRGHRDSSFHSLFRTLRWHLQRFKQPGRTQLVPGGLLSCRLGPQIPQFRASS
jgi:hypothetical protein